MTVTQIRRPKPESQDLGTFLMILDQYAVGTEVHIDMLRSDLEAAQIAPSSYGGLFGAAVTRGELRPTYRTKRCGKSSRRSGYAQIYKRTRPKQAPKTSRPTTKRTDTKGPRR